jgi:ankyrin repeat protein
MTIPIWLLKIRLFVISRLADFYCEHGEYGKALPLFERWLKISEPILDPNDPSIAIVRQNIEHCAKAANPALQLTSDEIEAEQRDQNIVALARQLNNRGEKDVNPLPDAIQVGRAVGELEYWSMAGNVGKVKLALQNNADPNEKLRNGETPLHVATNFGHVEIVQILLAAGADATTKSDSGEAALDVARKTKRDDLISLLESNQQ